MAEEKQKHEEKREHVHDHKHEHSHAHEKHEEKKEVTKVEEVKEKKEKKPVHQKIKKTFAVVTAQNIPISVKQSSAIGRFIKNKKIDDAVNDLELVVRQRKAVPMRGEIPHRRGKGMMAGRFPRKASENFIRLLKSLKANANYNGLENPIIVESIANIGERPYGRFGAVRKKRAHIKIVAKDILEIKPKEKK